MKTLKTQILLIVVLACTAAPLIAQDGDASAQTTAAPDPAKMFEPREYAAENGDVLKYRLLKPAEFDPEAKYPLVVFLHGAGERGEDNTAQLKHCLSEFCRPERREKFACYVLAPQCPKDQKWLDVDWRVKDPQYPDHISRPLELTMAVVDAMLADAAVDKQRVYFIGLSMGGFGTWDAMLRRPELIAAAIPICGGGATAEVQKFKHIPIWCFHGDADQAVSVEKSREMVAALKAAGGSPRYTEYPGVQHDSWTRTMANEEVFEWLFAQRRTPPSEQE